MVDAWFDDCYEVDEMISFEELYGIHVISGFENTIDKFGFSAVKFILDGKTYMAVCDPDDGWRSSLGCIVKTEDKCATNLPNIIVEIRKADDKDLSGIVFIIRDNRYSARPFIWLGTLWTDSWYPSCEMRYIPENIVELRQ